MRAEVNSMREELGKFQSQVPVPQPAPQPVQPTATQNQPVPLTVAQPPPTAHHAHHPPPPAAVTLQPNTSLPADPYEYHVDDFGNQHGSIEGEKGWWFAYYLVIFFQRSSSPGTIPSTHQDFTQRFQITARCSL